MNMEEVKEKFAKIENILKELKELKEREEENKAQIRVLQNKAVEGLFKMKEYFEGKVRGCDEDKFLDVFYKFMEYIIHNYDCDRPLENFANHVWGQRKSMVYKNGKEDNTISLDENISMDDTTELYEKIEDKKDTPEQMIIASDVGNSVLLDIAVAISKIFEHGYTKQNNPIREKYYRLMYTGRMTDIVKEGNLTSAKIRHEKQIMDTCNLNFLDFYMAEICRTITEVNVSALKRGYEVGDMKTNEERIALPLQKKVYEEYMRRFEKKEISDALFSQNKKNYDELLRKLEILN